MLVEQGVGPGQRVALLFNRSVEAIVAIFAILKTGAAYVPIDPVVPDSRLDFVLRDSAAMAVVTTTDLTHRLVGHELKVIDVRQAAAPAPDDRPGAALPVPQPEDIAYLIYTSGTTGVPKGVAIPHCNVTRLLESLDTELELSADQV
nr:AMP-binding protein [Streptomyces sp. DSM 41633]